MMTSTPELETTQSPPRAKVPRNDLSSAAILRAYKNALTPKLDPKVFEPNPWRMGWFFSLILGVALSLFVIVELNPAWPIKLGFGLLLGSCTGILAFLSHEISHGTVVKNQRLQTILHFFGTAAFLISPTYWKFSHNRLHHGKPQKLIEDPDAFPNLRIYKASKFSQFIFPFTPGSGHKRSYAYFFFWFSFHNFVSQVYLRYRNRIFDEMDHKQVTLEFALQIILCASIAIYAGPANWLWVVVIPIMVQNYLLMSYISTNHNLSPLTHENDPLVNSLSVSNHPIIEFFTLNFGYHVEHHIFPKVNGKHVRAVHQELVKQFPEKYKIMPKWDAMVALYRTPRIYKNAHTLIHPETLETFPTI